jgi:hypothetical protein
MIMTSKRWKKSPSSIMFMELFKYIAGVNQVRVQILAARWFWKLIFIFFFISMFRKGRRLR